MKTLTEEQQNLLAGLAADEIHKSLMEAAQQRYMSEVTSYESVKQGVTTAFQKIFRNFVSVDSTEN